MKVEQYRLSRIGAGWRVQMTFGFMNTEFMLRTFAKQKDARDACKAHALRNGDTKPIILT